MLLIIELKLVMILIAFLTTTNGLLLYQASLVQPPTLPLYKWMMYDEYKLCRPIKCGKPT